MNSKMRSTTNGTVKITPKQVASHRTAAIQFHIAEINSGVVIIPGASGGSVYAGNGNDGAARTLAIGTTVRSRHTGHTWSCPARDSGASNFDPQ